VFGNFRRDKMRDFVAVILAAGEGTRMKSNTPKVLHKVCGVPMLAHVVRAAKDAGASKVIAVVGKGAEEVKQYFQDTDIEFVLQERQLGTGHALLQARGAAEGISLLVVLCGDMPLITGESIRAMVKYHIDHNADATVMTAEMDDPTGYGRILRDGEKVIGIREEKDASDEEKRIREINSGCYCFDTKLVFEALTEIKNDNVQKEYYLTDVVEILNNKMKSVVAYVIPDAVQISGINDREQLAFAQKAMQQRIIRKHMKQGVTFIDPANVMVDYDVTIGRDTVIYPGTFLEGNTSIGEGCTIIGGRIKNSKIGDHVEIVMSQIQESFVDSEVKIGPYANLRPGCHISVGAKIGDFVELKNTTLGEGSKVPHLSYVGDARIGKKVNIGAGVIFVNYDGYNKYQTVVEDRAFIGCNSNLIAPVTIRKDSFVAAGSTITKEVPEDSLAIARSKQENKPGWVSKRRKKFEGGKDSDAK